MKWRVSGSVTITVSTLVEAESQSQALALARRRENAQVNVDPSYPEDEFWTPGEDLDGSVRDLLAEPEPEPAK